MVRYANPIRNRSRVEFSPFDLTHSRSFGCLHGFFPFLDGMKAGIRQISSGTLPFDLLNGSLVSRRSVSSRAASLWQDHD